MAPEPLDRDEDEECEGCSDVRAADELVECERCASLVCPSCVVPGDDATGDWCILCD